MFNIYELHVKYNITETKMLRTFENYYKYMTHLIQIVY